MYRERERERVNELKPEKRTRWATRIGGGCREEWRWPWTPTKPRTSSGERGLHAPPSRRWISPLLRAARGDDRRLLPLCRLHFPSQPPKPSLPLSLSLSLRFTFVLQIKNGAKNLMAIGKRTRSEGSYIYMYIFVLCLG